jgi:hypothetical protein
MTNRAVSKTARRIAARTLVFGAVMSLVAPAPLSALDGQILSGGGEMVLPGRYFSAPGVGAVWYHTNSDSSFGSEQKARIAAQIKMPDDGELSRLWVRVVTRIRPQPGSVVITVTLDGNPTPLTCTIVGQGNCTSDLAKVAFSRGDHLSVEINNTQGGGTTSIAYSMLVK